jgi:hypothetical protein
MGLTALVCLLAFGSLCLWAGFCIGSGRAHPPELMLRMPSGLIMGGLCISAGLFCGLVTAKEFARAEKGWHASGLEALAFWVTGVALLVIAL